ncbi:MAG: hypothetical protein FWG30_09935, partial [Eubacteriaceae bacterium]|nr:hypothetical protein [Eubacteriaceae bacterium]
FIQKCFHGMEHIWSWDRSTNECMYELLQIGHMLIQLVAMELAAAVEAIGLKYVVGACLFHSTSEVEPSMALLTIGMPIVQLCCLLHL